MDEQLKRQFLQVIQDNQGIIQSICQVYYPLEEDRKDARQNIILQLWKAFPTFRQESKVSTWIYRVALHTVLAQLRQERKRPHNVSLSVLEEQLPSLPAADDEFQQLMQIISHLKDTEKAVVILHLEGYNHQEIATMLQTSTTNISTRMNRIRNKIKNLYKICIDETR